MSKQQSITTLLVFSLIITSAPFALSSSVSASSFLDPTVECNPGYFGVDVHMAGDVNGDGYADVIVGASGCDSGLGVNQGRVYVFHGSATGTSPTADWSFAPDKADARLGTSVSLAGDVNGDGFDDVIVGAPRYNAGLGGNQGKVFAFYGSTAGLPDTPNWSILSDQHPGDFGYSVSSAGDINKDGFDDVIVGTPSYTVDQTWEGRAFIYPGSATGLSTTPWTLDGNNDYSRFGASVNAAGDVNKDGFDDVLVGAFQFGYPPAKGGAFLFYGSATGIVPTPAWTSLGVQVDARYGAQVASAGDVNNDGFLDIAVSETLYDDGSTINTGRVYLFHGSATGPSLVADWTLTGEQASEGLGIIASAGDVNKDGFDDLLVGGSGYSPSASLSTAGRTRIFFGSPTGLSMTAGWTVLGDQAGGLFGNAVSLAGDVDKNGYSDVIIGASRYDGDYTDAGRAYVFCADENGLGTTPCRTIGSGAAILDSHLLYLPVLTQNRDD